MAELVKVVGLSSSTIRRMEKAGDFPRRRRLAKRAVGWLASDVDEWLAGLQQEIPSRDPLESSGMRGSRVVQADYYDRYLRSKTHNVWTMSDDVLQEEFESLERDDRDQDGLDKDDPSDDGWRN